MEDKNLIKTKFIVLHNFGPDLNPFTTLLIFSSCLHLKKIK